MGKSEEHKRKPQEQKRQQEQQILVRSKKKKRGDVQRERENLHDKNLPPIEEARLPSMSGASPTTLRRRRCLRIGRFLLDLQPGPPWHQALSWLAVPGGTGIAAGPGGLPFSRSSKALANRSAVMGSANCSARTLPTPVSRSSLGTPTHDHFQCWAQAGPRHDGVVQSYSGAWCIRKADRAGWT